MQQKKCSNQKSEENKPTLKFNFLWKFKCASLYFQFWVLGANLDEPYWAKSEWEFRVLIRTQTPLCPSFFPPLWWKEGSLSKCILVNYTNLLSKPLFFWKIRSVGHWKVTYISYPPPPLRAFISRIWSIANLCVWKVLILVFIV